MKTYENFIYEDETFEKVIGIVDRSSVVKNIFHPNTKIIGPYTFKDSKFEVIKLPENCKIISSYAFADSPNLQTIYLNEGLRIIEEGAFARCKKLVNINLPDTLEYIGSCAFFSTPIKEIILPENLFLIGGNAFSNCDLEKITILSNIDSLPNCCFFDNNNLEFVDFNNTKIKILNNDVFSYCKKLETVILPTTIKCLQSNVFNECPNLKLIIADRNVKIDNETFFSKYLFNKDAISCLIDHYSISEINQILKKYERIE